MADLRRLPMDNRIPREIMSSASMRSENPNVAGSFGGSEAYYRLSKVDEDARVVYEAVDQGISTPQEIADLTGIRPADVTRALAALRRQGLVQDGVVTR